MDHDSTLITLGKVDPKSKWITEATDLVFSDKDLDWVDQVDRDAKAVAIAEEDRARADIGATNVGEGGMKSQAKIIVVESSRNYLRHIRRRDASSSEP